MDLGFRGEVAEFYHQYRHGYPAEAIDALTHAFGLTARDVVADLGCGTGQLTLPVAGRARAVVGIDPEPDMLMRGRRAASDQGVTNVTWMVGADTDLPALGALLGPRSLGAVTVGQALHWMNHAEVFRAVVPLARAGGGVAVVTNGTPLWLQETAWSRALRDVLQRWLQTTLTSFCGTDAESQRRYASALTSAGYEVLSATVGYTTELTIDQIVGGVYSAMPVSRLPAFSQRPLFAEQVRAALAPHEPFTEHVRVAMLFGRLP
jgi:ubiquinone/menaquinone biosynthesis C-methylase UbiE